MQRFITVNENNIVKSVRLGEKIAEGEIASEIGDIGQIKEGKSFITPEKVITEPQPTQLDRIEAKLDSLLAVKTQ
jgi:hypothetical protein